MEEVDGGAGGARVVSVEMAASEPGCMRERGHHVAEGEK